MQSQASKIILTVIITVAIVAVGVYFWQQQQSNETPQKVSEVTQELNTTQNQPTNSIVTITIMVPKDQDIYREKVIQFVQEGGDNPSQTLPFIMKELNVPYTNNLIKASAQAAAEQIPPAGGPPKASVTYLKVQNSIAYVLLDIDLDGWAGVSFSLATIHPLVEKTLLQFPEIDQVVFDFAPGDSIDNIKLK